MSCSPLETTRESRETPGALAGALASVLTRAGIDPMLEGTDLQEALHRAISLHRSSCTWTKVHVGWVVTLQFPEPRRFFGRTLEEALAWSLASVMARETRYPLGHETEWSHPVRRGWLYMAAAAVPIPQ